MHFATEPEVQSPNPKVLGLNRSTDRSSNPVASGGDQQQNTIMEAALPLDQMTVDEKLRAMEALWADLQQSQDDVPVPDWHLAALRETEQRVREGLEQSIDWEEAKRILRERFK